MQCYSMLVTTSVLLILNSTLLFIQSFSPIEFILTYTIDKNKV